MWFEMWSFVVFQLLQIYWIKITIWNFQSIIKIEIHFISISARSDIDEIGDSDRDDDDDDDDKEDEDEKNEPMQWQQQQQQHEQ